MKRTALQRRPRPQHLRPRRPIVVARKVTTGDVQRRYAERHYALADRFAPDPAHLLALHAPPGRLERLARWPRGRHASLILRTIQTCNVLVVLAGVTILALVHEPGLD